METPTPDTLWTAFRSLPANSRDAFLERLVHDPLTREDLEDLLDVAMADERMGEPTRPLDDVLAEIGR